jgi:hypothetical protein
MNSVSSWSAESFFHLALLAPALPDLICVMRTEAEDAASLYPSGLAVSARNMVYAACNVSI